MLLFSWPLLVDGAGTSQVIAAVTKLNDEVDGDLCMMKEDADADFWMLNEELDGDLCTTVECVGAMNSWLSSESVSESLSESDDDRPGGSGPTVIKNHIYFKSKCKKDSNNWIQNRTVFEVDWGAGRRFPTVMVNDSHRLGLHSAAGAVIMEVAWQDARIDILNGFAELQTQKR